MAKSIIDIKQLVFRSLREGYLGRALAQLAVIDAAYTEQVENLKSTYRTLLSYYMDGVDDPERHEIIGYIIKQAYELTDRICITHIPKSYCENPVFTTLFINAVYESDELDYIKRLLENGNAIECQLATSAIMLSSLNLFQEEKILALIDLCYSDKREVRLRAFTALIIVLSCNDERLIYYPRINNKLNILFDSDENIELSRNVIKYLLKAADTERIEKEISDNIMPEINKIIPELTKEEKEDEEKNDDFENSVENRLYKLQDKLEDSGIIDKMQTFANIQAEGGDINYPSFKSLKNFPFFNNIENWFMPFIKETREISNIFTGSNGIYDTLLNGTTMCDSDKYSLCLNLASVSPSARESLAKNFAESEDSVRANAILKEDDDRDYINRYIQDIFRFIKLHSDRRYYPDIFDGQLAYHKKSFFRFFNQDNEFLLYIARLYQDIKHYPEAIEAYNKLLESSESDIEILKSLGNCYIKTEQYAEALKVWQKADSLEPDEEGNIKKLAFLYKKLQNWEKAIKHYSVLVKTDPQNINYLYNLAACQAETGMFEEASNNLYKIIFIDKDVKNTENFSFYFGVCLWNEGKRKDAVLSFAKIKTISQLEDGLKSTYYNFTDEQIKYILDYVRLSKDDKH